MIKTSDSCIIKSERTISLTLWSLAMLFIFSLWAFSEFEEFIFALSNKGLSFPAVSNVIIFNLSFPSSTGKLALIPWVVIKNPLLFIKLVFPIILPNKNDFPLFLFPNMPTNTFLLSLHLLYFFSPSVPQVIFHPSPFNCSKFEKSNTIS